MPNMGHSIKLNVQHNNNKIQKRLHFGLWLSVPSKVSAGSSPKLTLTPKNLFNLAQRVNSLIVVIPLELIDITLKFHSFKSCCEQTFYPINWQIF